jgi:hypothetical protein
MLATGAALIEVLPTHNNAASEAAAAKIFFITISLVRSSPARAKTINFGIRAQRYKTFVAEQRRKSCLMRTPVTSVSRRTLARPIGPKALQLHVTLGPRMDRPFKTTGRALYAYERHEVPHTGLWLPGGFRDFEGPYSLRNDSGQDGLGSDCNCDGRERGRR